MTFEEWKNNRCYTDIDGHYINADWYLAKAAFEVGRRAGAEQAAHLLEPFSDPACPPLDLNEKCFSCGAEDWEDHRDQCVVVAAEKFLATQGQTPVPPNSSIAKKIRTEKMGRFEREYDAEERPTAESGPPRCKECGTNHNPNWTCATPSPDTGAQIQEQYGKMMREAITTAIRCIQRNSTDEQKKWTVNHLKEALRTQGGEKK